MSSNCITPHCQPYIRTGIQVLAALPALASLLIPGIFAGSAHAKAESEDALRQPHEYAGSLSAVHPGTKEKIFLPLRSTRVHIQVTGGIAESEVVQTFRNETEYPLEAIYMFPLPESATVTDMELVVGDIRVRSVVREKEEARAVYKKAKEEGRRAAILEQKRPNVFTNSVANFMPGETVKIRFNCVHTLQFAPGRYALMFPMVVGPRYIPGDGSVGDPSGITAPILHPSTDPKHRLSFEIDIVGLPIAKITSETHAIATRKIADDPKYRVRLANLTTLPNSDFSLRFDLSNRRAPDANLIGSVRDGSRYLMLQVLPPVEKLAEAQLEKPRDVVFLIDTSGSMSGESIGQARTGLLRCLEMLRSQDRFTIVRFASDFSYFSPELRPATKAKLNAARAYVKNLQANGGTEMQPALSHVLSLPSRPGATRQVIFLTDGAVGNEVSLMRLLDSQLGKSRLFALGIGSAPNEFLVRKMAERGRGSAEFIRTQENVGEVIAQLFASLESAVLTDVSITWKDTRGRIIPDVVFYPRPVPDLFHGRPVRIFAELPEGMRGAVEITGTLQGRPYRRSIDLAPTGSKNLPAVEKLFGKAHINHLMADWLHAESDLEKTDVRSQVVEAALTHQLVTQFTSRLLLCIQRR